MVAYEFDQHLPEFNLVGDDLNLLANVGTLIVPEIDAVLSEFYAHALNDADLAKYFKTEASVDHARMAQKAHWINNDKKRHKNGDEGCEFHALSVTFEGAKVK